jgi:hypothetical protein
MVEQNSLTLSDSALAEKLQAVKAVILDVDGVLTDGGIYYDPTGREHQAIPRRRRAGD